MKYIRIKHTNVLHPYAYTDELYPYAYTDELHPYESYRWTTFVCSTSYLRMYFIHIQLTDLLHPYVKNTRSTRTPITQKSQKMCTSAEIKPPPVTLSPSPNRYLSQHLQNDHQREKPDHNDKNQAFNTKQHNNIGVILKKNTTPRLIQALITRESFLGHESVKLVDHSRT